MLSTETGKVTIARMDKIWRCWISTYPANYNKVVDATWPSDIWQAPNLAPEQLGESLVSRLRPSRPDRVVGTANCSTPRP